MSNILVADIETNGLKPTEIYMVGIMDLMTKEYTAYIGEDEVPLGLMRLLEADLIVGHNFKGYDAKVIRKLTEGLIDIPDEKIDDTLDMARALFPEMPNHKLATWGEILGVNKLDYQGGFDKFTPEMIPYCQRDVEVNAALYEFFLTQIETLA